MSGDPREVVDGAQPASAGQYPEGSGKASGVHVLKRFGVVILKTPKYALLVANLARDGRLTRRQRLGSLACLGYMLLPIDLVPGIIPVAGQLDDLAVLVGGLKLVLRTVPPAIGIEQLRRAGLSARDVDSDLSAVRDTAVWLRKQGVTQVNRLLKPIRKLGTSPSSAPK